MRMHPTRFCLVLLLGSGSAFAQKPASPASPAAKTIPILLNIQVADKKGHPISGLQQTDFTLLDDGKPAPIQLFRELSGSDPGTVSIMLLIDDINPDFNEVVYTRGQILKLLRGYGPRLPAPLSISVLTWSSVHQLVPPSTDGIRLAQEFEESQAHLRPVPEGDQYGQYDRWHYSTLALEEIMNAQARLPGRLLLVWIGPGWALFDSPDALMIKAQQTFWMRMIVGLSTGLRSSRITLDSVDPLGLQDGAYMLATHWQSFLKPVRKPSDAWWADLSLQVLATGSGGQVLYSSNDAAGEIAACVQDAADFYAIRFDGQSSDQPNTWHDLDVKVDRPGVVVRTNKGYYAQP